ncbi:39S ribosomal protein L30, mitochondrial isoform X3 [Ornithorhynchus anatinus]|uniref:39S ribosomal protein L30, mitochondrial isoform X3 n=1 Tax=Ornithorhynchus anatinus TaxID=9258 RepID=UPI0010A84E02|nr:39S ribosomal protein L30, mitochondrial isoform X3 [Ornithorhynchus anatinus]
MIRAAVGGFPAAPRVLRRSSPESPTWAGWIRQKFTKSRIPDEVFRPSAADHRRYGGDPENPHKLHLVTRIKSVKGRPYWEKNTAHHPQVHKNIPSVNAKLKTIKHLVRIRPLILPQGLPTEEDVGRTCLKNTGELVTRWSLTPAAPPADDPPRDAADRPRSPPGGSFPPNANDEDAARRRARLVRRPGAGEVSS